jgi:3,4-dihydroxy 2-butanone 4-phosphate synthase/GTP cyclohydrolase II
MTNLAPVETILKDAREGRMFILVDDESRENEGDLVIPAVHVTPAHINFMAKHGRGLICLALASEQVRKLGLKPMAQHNGSRHHTAFTVSIEARHGVTTGISAADRARTVQAAIAEDAAPSDVVSPGHIFPLEAKDGGTLVRAGHTEAAVDVARLAGLHPSGVICEILNDDGAMARLPDLLPFAERHGMHVGAIVDLIAYRRRCESLIERLASCRVDSIYGGAFLMHIYRNKITGTEHLAFVKGDPASGEEPVYVRMHVADLFEDAVGLAPDGGAPRLRRAMEFVAGKGRGVVVLLREDEPRTLLDMRRQADADPRPSSRLRDYGIGAQILKDLGVERMALLTGSPKSVVGLDGYGLKIAEICAF